jgi:hypothetical protein
MQRVSWTDICLFPRSAGRRRAGADEKAKASERVKASKEPGAAREAGPWAGGGPGRTRESRLVSGPRPGRSLGRRGGPGRACGAGAPPPTLSATLSRPGMMVVVL